MARPKIRRKFYRYQTIGLEFWFEFTGNLKIEIPHIAETDRKGKLILKFFYEQFELFKMFKLQHPIVEEETKRFNRFCLFSCCASDPFFMIAAIPVSGYTPGQMINVDLELANNSNEHIAAFVLKIIRVFWH